jgi:glycosyltransferase involved in cell wall biosynthesis
MSRETSSVILSGGHLGGGGVQTHLSLLCKLLRQENIDVVLLASASNWPADVLADVRAAGVHVMLPPGFLGNGLLARVATLFNIKFRLKRGCHTVYTIGEGRAHWHVVRRLAPQSFSLYHEIVDARNPGMTTVRCTAPVDAYVANSEPVGREMQELVPSSSVRVIPFLTSTAPTPPPAPRPPVGDRPLRVVYLGRLAAHKRPDVLVREWRALTASGPIGPAELDVYGYGELHDSLKETVSASGLGDIVRIRGRYSSDELPGILAAADVVVLPSFFEGLPLVLVEAMLAGVPIVACDAGGVRELGTDNPDAIITTTEWDDFVAGLREMAGRLRSGEIDAVRLHAWTEARYGFETVSRRWIAALTSPRSFFAAASSVHP